MNELENNQIYKLSRMQLTITLILILFFCVTGATYAYFAISASNSDTITGNAATVNLTLEVEKIFPTSTSNNTGVMVPQLSTSGNANSPLANALKKGCVDDNTNVVCQVYRINIANIGGTATEVVDGWISFYSDRALTTDVSSDMPNLRWKKITSVNATTPANSVLGTGVDLVADSGSTGDNIFANDIVLSTNVDEEYYIIIWLNETNNDQVVDEGKSFYAKVEFNASNGKGVTSTFEV